MIFFVFVLQFWDGYGIMTSVMKMLEEVKRMKYAVENAGLSYMELERKTGVSHSTLQRYLNGKTNRIPLSAVEKIANATNVSAAWIMGWEESPNVTPLPDNIIPMPKMRRIPLLGTIACGEPILAAENIEGDVDTPDNIHVDFALRCKGDSMINARIYDGDIVYIRQQPDVENGEIAAVLIGDEATLKRVYKSEGQVTLMPANDNYPPLVYTGEQLQELHIIGKAVAFTSTVR